MPDKTVREAMTTSPKVVSSTTTVVDAARAMTTENVGSLPIVDEEKLVGIVTDRDLVTNVLAKDLDPHKVPVSDVGTENPVFVGPEDPLDAALQRMAEKQVRRLPVVEDGRLVGILAQADVSRTAHAESTGPHGRGDLRELTAAQDRNPLARIPIAQIPKGVRFAAAASPPCEHRRVAQLAHQLQHQPLATVAAHGLDRIDERIENPRESLVGSAPLDERADRDGHALIRRFHLDGHLFVPARLEHAEDGELEVVHSLVRKIQAAADSTEDESGDTCIRGARGNGEGNPIGHVGLHAAPSPTLASVARPGDVEVQVEASRDGGATVVRVEGDLDLSTCPELEHALEGADLADRVVVDLSGCTFFDSSALRVLVQRARAAATAGGTTALVTTDPGILRVLEIATTDAMLPVHDTLESASRS